MREVFDPVVALVVLMCAAFSAAAQGILWTKMAAVGYEGGPGFVFRLGVKALLFAILASAAAAFFFRRVRRLPSLGDSHGAATKPGKYSRAILAAALGLSVLLFFPFLDRYPWAAPDELHHLIVSRNLSEHGAYASGHPETGLRYFDYYDSIGPALIGPVAASFAVGGTGVIQGRTVVAFFGLAVCLLAYGFMKPTFGPAAAAWSVPVMLMASGSIYLSRSLYGEVPAFAYFLAGLMLWRRALEGGRFSTALLAGICFGLAVLTKTFFLISVFAFAAVWLFDWRTARRISVTAVLVPGAGVAAVLGIWSGLRFFYRHLESEGIESFLLYFQHHLMFGLDPAPVTLGWLSGFGGYGPQAGFNVYQLMTFVSMICVAGLVAGFIFRERYDPPMAVLYLTAVLFLFWWVFFTPGNLPRYTWYSLAIAGMFSGVAIQWGLEAVRKDAGPPLRKAAWGCLLFLVLIPGSVRLYEQWNFVFRVDELADELALAKHVSELPPEVTIASLYWPVGWSMNFLAHRPVKIFYDPEEEEAPSDLQIVRDPERRIDIESTPNARRFGQYVIVSNEP